MYLKTIIIWLPLLASLANYVPLTKYHWVFELNREFFFFYLCHHVLVLLFLWGRWRSKWVASLLALSLTFCYGFTLRLPPLFPELFKAEGTQLALRVFPSNDKDIAQTKPTKDHYDYEIGLVFGGEGSNRGNIFIEGQREFTELPNLDPGIGVRVGRIRTVAGDITLAIVNIDVPLNKKGIYERKVMLRRINSVFRHPFLKSDGPRIIRKKARLNFDKEPILLLGNFGASPFTWDVQQFWHEDNFEVTPLRWSAALGIPGKPRLFLANRGVKGIVIDSLKDQVIVSIPPDSLTQLGSETSR
jgi:hypothetical protein